MADLVPPLRKFRERQKPRLTLEALAEQVGISLPHLSRVERFGTNSLPLAMRLRELTGLPVETFSARTITRDAA